MSAARTPEAIEREAERRMDQLDRHLMRGDLTQSAYDEACRRLDRWTQRQYARWDAHRTMRDWRAPEWPSVGAR